MAVTVTIGRSNWSRSEDGPAGAGSTRAALTQFADLLARALTEPGIISTAYTAFHGYSLGNQILAFVQCAERGIPPGPIATFPGWKEKGRYVRKGEKAIVLCMPLTCKRKPNADPSSTGSPEPDADQQAETFTRFVYRPNWFVLSQTEGPGVEPIPVPAWDRPGAFATLKCTPEGGVRSENRRFTPEKCPPNGGALP
jgi:N-terminal domain of anti-restriction factor ArdC